MQRHRHTATGFADRPTGEVRERAIVRHHRGTARPSRGDPGWHEDVRAVRAAEPAWEGRPFGQNSAMAVVLDKLLGKGLFPDGFEYRATGRRYKYKAD